MDTVHRSVWFLPALFLSCLLVMPNALCGPVDDPLPILAVMAVRAVSPPAVDGRLEEPGWEKTVVAGDFRRVGAPRPASQPTLVRAMYDTEALYLAYECIEPDTAGLVCTHTEHDSEIWFDDSVELFVDPTHSHERYYQLAVNCEGVRFDKHMEDVEWTAPWRAATSTAEGAWFAEVAIPFSALGVQAPSPGDIFAVNFCRNRKAKAGGGPKEHGEWSCWARTESGYHEPERFGHLIFGGAGGVDTTVLERLASDPKCSRGTPNVLPVRLVTHSGSLEYVPYRAQALAELQGAGSELEKVLERIERMLARADELDENQQKTFTDRLDAIHKQVAALQDEAAADAVGQLTVHRITMAKGELLSQATDLEWDLKFELLFAGVD